MEKESKRKGYGATAQIILYYTLCSCQWTTDSTRRLPLPAKYKPNTRTENVWFMVPGYTRVNTVIYLHPMRFSPPWTQGIQCQNIRINSKSQIKPKQQLSKLKFQELSNIQALAPTIAWPQNHTDERAINSSTERRASSGNGSVLPQTGIERAMN